MKHFRVINLSLARLLALTLLTFQFVAQTVIVPFGVVGLGL